MQKKFKPCDIAVIALVLCVALLLWLFPWMLADSDRGVLVVSFSDGEEQTYPLSESRTLTLTGNGHTLTVVIENSTAYVRESDCPDGICRMGAISKTGEMLVCAPAGIALTVQSEGRADFDAILG